MNFTISLTIGIAAAIIAFIFLYEPQSALEKRFKKKFRKKESFMENIVKNLHELLKPISEKNTKSTNAISQTKKLLLQAGEPSSEEDVIKFETQKITIAFIAF